MIRTLAEQAGVINPDGVTEAIGMLIDGAIIAAVITGTSDHARRGADAVRMILASQVQSPQSSPSHANAA